MLKCIAVSASILLFAFHAHLAAETFSAPSASEPPEVDVTDYEIAPSDLLRFQVYQEEDLAREVRVSQAGNITLPLVQTVNVKGMTIGEAQEHLTELYNKDYLVNPQINLSVVEYSQRRVNVMGYVNSPGVVVFPPEESMTLIDAIAGAGGFQPRAASTRVILTRTTENGRTETYTINVDEIIRGRSEVEWKLKRGDYIYVPQSLI